LWQGSEQISLPLKSFAVLRYLVENPGRLITHDELLDALWPETYVQPQVLRTYMLELRKLLGDDAGKPRFIQTLPKRGYCFVAAVTDAPETGKPTERRRATDQQPAADAETKAEAAPKAGKIRAGTVRAGTVGAGEVRAGESSARELVGRDAELAHLSAQMLLAVGGQRRVCFVTGESGIGKTSLVDAFCRHLDPVLEACPARGQCVEGFGSREEYYPVMEALSHLCGSPDGERACRTLARMAPAWLSALGRDCGPAGAAGTLKRMPGDLCGALEELAAEQPLVLIFEDMHWADEATLHLISALARRRAQARLLVLATYRPRSRATEAIIEYADQPMGSDHSIHLLKQDLLLRRLCTETILGPLARSAVRELLIQELQQKALPASLADFVHHRSEGNPLFVLATLEHLIVEGFLVRKTSDGTSTWETPRPLKDLQSEKEASAPNGLVQMVELEIERLSSQDQRLLEAASLINFAFPAWAVAAALEQDAEETEEALDALARKLSFVHRAGQDELPDGSCSAFYVFAHELYREVLYQRQTATRRARRHIRIAERLGALFVDSVASVAREMALHFEAAGDWRRAITALHGAAEHARARKASAEAEELLEHALRIAVNLPEPERHSMEIEIRRSSSAGELKQGAESRMEVSAKV
jgi:DNA-binding winged helix-turn-helix (wHTH) protein